MRQLRTHYPELYQELQLRAGREAYAKVMERELGDAPEK